MAGFYALMDEPEAPEVPSTTSLPEEPSPDEPNVETAGAMLRGIQVEAEEAVPPPARDLDPAEGHVLRIGEGLDLEQGRVLRGAQAHAADVLVLDIHRGHGAVLACAHGGSLLPKSEELAPKGIELLGIAELMTQAKLAPERLEREQISLSRTDAHSERRIGFAASESQQAWRLELTHVSNDPIATDRRIQLRTRAVERGDLVSALGLETPKTEDLPRSATLEHVVRLAKDLRRDAPFISWLGRNIARSGPVADALPGGLRLDHHAGAVFASRLDRRILASGHASIHALGGTGPNAEVELAHHSVLRVVGDLEGRILLKDHGSLVIEGDLLGHVSCLSWAKVIVLGDLRGELALGSHAQVFLLGEIRRAPTITASHVRLFVDQHLDEGDIQRLFPKPGRYAKLYIPSGAWPAGTHKDTAGFGEVIVGGDRWDTIRLR